MKCEIFEYRVALEKALQSHLKRPRSVISQYVCGVCDEHNDYERERVTAPAVFRVSDVLDELANLVFRTHASPSPLFILNGFQHLPRRQ